MTVDEHVQGIGTRSASPTGTGDDAILEHLQQAELQYRAFRASFSLQASQFAEAQIELTNAQAARDQFAEEATTLRDELQRARQRAEQQRLRANQLALALRDVNRALFSSDVYTLILRACLTITRAERGLYLTSRGPEGNLRVRAALKFDGYPQIPLSPYIEALCRKVLQDQDTFVCNDKDVPASLPPPTLPSEHFRNCVVAPVVLMKNFDGIIIVADKQDGDFDEDDIEALLNIGDQAAVAVENAHLQRELQAAYLSTVTVLADAVEAKDPYTHGHCEDVSRHARLTAARLGLSAYDRSVVSHAALLHDVGKIGISDGLLNKPGALLPEERELMRSHVRVGHDLIANVPALAELAHVILHHHEWFDGSGYPNQLKGDEIPIAARIVAVADAYGAMLSKRSYKEAYSAEQARNELLRCAGTQFDPQVVDAFLAVLDQPRAQDGDADEDVEYLVLPGMGRLQRVQELGGASQQAS